MGIALQSMAERVGGTIVGDKSFIVQGAAPLQDVSPGFITLADSKKHLPALLASSAGAVVVSQAFQEIAIPQLVVAKPHEAFSDLVSIFRPRRTTMKPGIHSSAQIERDAQIDASSSIGPGVTIGNACVIGARTRIHAGVNVMDGSIIGNDCELFPGVILYPETIIEDRVLIHAGAVLGAYGFGYRLHDGKHQRTSQHGWVHIESDVEIGANSTIDRGTFGATKIGQGSKLDNQVMIGHNCRIGKHNLLCAHVGIAGSSTTGDYVVLAGQVGVKDHTQIGNRVVVGAQAGVAADVDDGQVMLGSPAIPQKEQLHLFILQRRVPQMRDQIKALEKAVEQLQAQLKSSEAMSTSRSAA